MSRARDIANLIGGATPDIILKTSDGAILNLQTSDTTVTADSVLGAINFQAPNEADGTDSILVASKIEAIAEGAFSASSNATSLVFSTAASAAAGTVSGKMTFTSGGNLIIKDTDTADGSSPTITLQTGDTDIAQDDVLGTINFQAPDEGTGTDAILVAAGIEAVSEGDFSSSSNATKLVFKTGASEAASSKMTLSSAGLLTIADDLMIKDGGTIGVASTNDALTISSAGLLTVKDDLVIKSGGTIGGAGDTDLLTLGSAVLTVAGATDTLNFKVNGAQGSDGQVLTSTGSGVGWENAAAGGATTLIGTTTLGSNAASITVTGFSTSHDMYVMYFDLRGDQTDGSTKSILLRVTNDAGAAYTTSFYNTLTVTGTSGPNQTDQASFKSPNHFKIGGRDDTGNGAWYNGSGVGVTYIFNPKNTTANFNVYGYGFQRADVAADLYCGGIEDIDVDVGGMQFTRSDGGNFEAGSSMTIIGFNRS